MATLAALHSPTGNDRHRDGLNSRLFNVVAGGGALVLLKTERGAIALSVSARDRVRASGFACHECSIQRGEGWSYLCGIIPAIRPPEIRTTRSDASTTLFSCLER